MGRYFVNEIKSAWEQVVSAFWQRYPNPFRGDTLQLATEHDDMKQNITTLVFPNLLPRWTERVFPNLLPHTLITHKHTQWMASLTQININK
uniref:PRELI/MSF1 domain-containing protein n=1 Tax=Hucho hucho TaxID=62062 RepID=A0A4W5K2J1_9TELE